MKRLEQLRTLAVKKEALMYETLDYVWANPEPGYREWKTTAYLAQKFEELGYTLTMAGDIPGFYADLDTGRPGPKIAILGEMDSLIVPEHPDADPETGAAHACGHHGQCAILVGVAAALKEPGALDGLCGSIRLMAVPAEELIELEFREELRKQGIIKYWSGKVEYIYRGYFDGVDMAMEIHAGELPDGKILKVLSGFNGCFTKNITFKGAAAHAGGAPHLGHNALYAANCAMNAVNALRETFVEQEHIRFHPIITEGGAAVNAIPETVRMESYVRGASFDGIVDYNEKINRALAGSAAAMGCNVELDDRLGYFPLKNDENLTAIMKQAAELIGGPGCVIEGGWGNGSSDMGDVSAIMPILHPHCSGSRGAGHSKDSHLEDRILGCLYPVQCLLMTAFLLLEEDAKRAKKVIAEAKPYFKTKEEYLKAIDGMTMKKEAVVYGADGRIMLDFASKELKGEDVNE